ncbi:MAG: hypothetical protein A2X49_17155 [Lentisphaerae bacterium GWF2_52_8]|nr:MAG: hypothetical protein A2X49_17155 [Lentisphaerae bacterium GWF2_52_8]
MKSIVLSKDDIELSFNPKTGEYSAKVGTFALKDCRPGLEVGGKKEKFGAWKIEKSSATALTACANSPSGKWLLTFKISAKGPAPSLSIHLSGELKKIQAKLKLNALELDSLPANHVLAQGLTMGSCESLKLGKGEKHDFKGHYQLMIAHKGEKLQLAFPLMQSQPALFTGKTNGSKIESFAAGVELLNYGKKRIAADALTLRASHDGFRLMYEYANANVEDKRDFSEAIAPGWNSWDYYRWTITEDEVLENAEFIAADPVLSKHIKKIIVDDGWQYCYGEWEANSLFPSGMESLARKLSKLGFAPGLWFAPSVVEPHARIAQMDYDMLAHGDCDEPCLCFECMRRYGFVLDPTQEKVRKHLYEMFGRYAKMGYKYFKLDFLGSTLRARKFADAGVPRSQIIRKIVEPVHEAVKGRANILGCNYVFNAGTRYVDAVRVGGDIHSCWGSIKENTVSVAARFWANKRLWINDPDFALCRSFDTANDPDLTRLLACLVFITAEDPMPAHGLFKLVDIYRPQAEILLSVVLAAGGAVNLSDKMTRLNKEGLDLARRTVSAESGDAAIPLDLFENRLPKYWIQKLGKGHRVLLINWEDKPAELSLDLRKHGISGSKAVNFWTDAHVPLKNGVIKADLKPRSCLFVVLKD